MRHSTARRERVQSFSALAQHASTESTTSSAAELLDHLPGGIVAQLSILFTPSPKTRECTTRRKEAKAKEVGKRRNDSRETFFARARAVDC